MKKIIILSVAVFSLCVAKAQQQKQTSILKFDTQTLARWTNDGWDRGFPKLSMDITVKFFADSTIEYKVIEPKTKKVTAWDKFKWSKKIDKVNGNQKWINYTIQRSIAANKTEFDMINFEKDKNDKIVDMLLINFNFMVIFVNKNNMGAMSQK